MPWARTDISVERKRVTIEHERNTGLDYARSIRHGLGMSKPLVASNLIASAYTAIGSQRTTAGLLGISKTAVQEAVSRCPDEMATTKKTLAGSFAVAAGDALAEAWTPGLLPGFKSKMEAITGAAICADKVAKLTEQPGALVQINLLGQVKSALDDLSRVESMLSARPTVVDADASDSTGEPAAS